VAVDPLKVEPQDFALRRNPGATNALPSAIALQHRHEKPSSILEASMLDHDQAALVASTLATFACVFGVFSVFLLMR
jgi:hypothetical protein